MSLYLLLISLVVAWCVAFLLFRYQIRKTNAEIRLLPQFRQAAPEVHPMVGTSVSRIHHQVPLPQDVLEGPAIVGLLSVNCPYCLSRLEEFLEHDVLRNHFPLVFLVEADEERQLVKFSNLYDDLRLIAVPPLLFQSLEFDLLPGFLLIDDTGTIRAAERRVAHLLLSTERYADLQLVTSHPAL